MGQEACVAESAASLQGLGKLHQFDPGLVWKDHQMRHLSRIALTALLVGVCCLAGCASSSGEGVAPSTPANESTSPDSSAAGAEGASQNTEAAESAEGEGRGADGAAQMQDADVSVPQQGEADAFQNEGGDMDAMTTANVAVLLNGTRFDLELADNDTAAAFAQMLPLQVEMSELNGNEKYLYLDESLPAHPTNPGTIEAGDVMLYGDNCLVVFYESHPTSYTYTRIGTIADTAGLAAAIGSGSISASFTLE